MWRNKHFIAVRLRDLEDPNHVLDRAVLSHARADGLPISPFSLSTSFCGSMNTTALSLF
jgi:hypothetical protein